MNGIPPEPLFQHILAMFSDEGLIILKNRGKQPDAEKEEHLK